MKICCPECGSTKNKKNGHIHNGKQNHFSGSDAPETPKCGALLGARRTSSGSG